MCIFRSSVIGALMVCLLHFVTGKFTFRHEINNLGNVRVDPEIYMNVSQLITSKGYPCEEYDVHTKDGYILGIQRIPHGRNARRYGSSARPVVLLQHGLLSSSSDWVDNLANQSLGFLLADAGFDVWLSNSRGNTYGIRHETLNPDQSQFWDFTWDEMATYDLPANVDKVLSVTGQSSLVYIGFSQGTQIAFAELSSNKKLASKIKLFIALAPVAYLGNVISPIRLLAPFGKELTFFFDVFGVKDFFPSNDLTRWLARYVCGKGLPNLLCENILFVFGGYDFKNMNSTRIPVYVSHSPAGTSTKNILHYAQSIQSGKFQKFDYGREDNLKHYNQPTPPQYDPKDINVPIVLYSGTADWLSVSTDIARLKLHLREIIRHQIIKDWEHLDFTWAMNGPQVCYNDIIDVIRLHYNLTF